MKKGSKNKQSFTKTIRLKTSFDSIVRENKSYSEKSKFSLKNEFFSLGKPYKFPDYQDASNTYYSSTISENSIKINKFRIQKIEKLQSILIQKSSKFRRVCNMSYKSQRTQRNQKILNATQDLQQIESINVQGFKPYNHQVIKIIEVRKINEILEKKRLSQTLFFSKGIKNEQTPRKNRSRFKNNVINTKIKQTSQKNSNLSTINFMQKALPYFHNLCQNYKIDPWQVTVQGEN